MIFGALPAAAFAAPKTSEPLNLESRGGRAQDTRRNALLWHLWILGKHSWQNYATGIIRYELQGLFLSIRQSNKSRVKIVISVSSASLAWIDFRSGLQRDWQEVKTAGLIAVRLMMRYIIWST